MYQLLCALQGQLPLLAVLGLVDVDKLTEESTLRNIFRKFSVLLFCLQLGVERNICEELIGLVLVIHAQTVVLQAVADYKIVDVE